MMNFNPMPRFGSVRSLLLILGVLILMLAGPAAIGGASITRADGVVDQTKEVVSGAVEKTKEAAEATGDKIEEMWHKIDAKRIANRTPDEIVAWVIMGVLVGSVAGMFTRLKNTGAGWFGRVALGLAGAIIGGIFVHFARINFGLGPVLIRYEDLLFALVGAVVLVVVGRLIRGTMSKGKAKKE